MPLVFGFSVYPPCETSYKKLQPVPLSIDRSRFSENTAAPFPLRWRPSLIYMSSFPTKSTFQHPKHWNVNPSSVVSDQVFPHPDTAKSTKLWQWLHNKCLLAFTCRLQGAILGFVKMNLVYTNLVFRKTVCLLCTATAAHFVYKHLTTNATMNNKFNLYSYRSLCKQTRVSY